MCSIIDLSYMVVTCKLEYYFDLLQAVCIWQVPSLTLVKTKFIILTYIAPYRLFSGFTRPQSPYSHGSLRISATFVIFDQFY